MIYTKYEEFKRVTGYSLSEFLELSMAHVPAFEAYCGFPAVKAHLHADVHHSEVSRVSMKLRELAKLGLKIDYSFADEGFFRGDFILKVYLY